MSPPPDPASIAAPAIPTLAESGTAFLVLVSEAWAVMLLLRTRRSAGLDAPLAS
jgi:hypothetical protein